MKREATLELEQHFSHGGHTWYFTWALNVKSRRWDVVSSGWYCDGGTAATAAHKTAKSLGITITHTEGLE